MYLDTYYFVMLLSSVRYLGVMYVFFAPPAEVGLKEAAVWRSSGSTVGT